MPRTPTILQNTYPYHVTARVINREDFLLPLHEVWEIMSGQLYWASVSQNAKIHSFVLMPNHFHLIFETPDSNLDVVMRDFMRETSKSINLKLGRINQTYGGRHHRTIISNGWYYKHAYKYVYRNPIKAGLCLNVEDYPYSTLHGLLGKSHAYIPVVEDSALFQGNLDATLNWLNRSTSTKHWDAVKNALTKKEFSLLKDPASKKPHLLEFNAL